MAHTENNNIELSQRMLDAAPSGVCFLAPDLTVKYANKSFADLHKETTETVFGKHVSELYEKKTFDTLVDHFTAGVNGKPQEFSIPLFTNGYPVVVRVQLVPDFNNDGDPCGAFAYFAMQYDNSSTAWAHESVFNSIPGRTCLIDENYVILHASRTMRKEYPLIDENRIVRLADVVPPKNWEATKEKIDLAFTGQETSLRSRGQADGNEKTNLAIYFTPVKNKDQTAVLGVYVLVFDETELVEAKSQLHRAEQNIDLALKSQLFAFWEVDHSRKDWLYTEHIERLLGMTPGSLGNSVSRFLELVHPDDRQELACSCDVEVFPENTLVNEFRCRTATGEYRWYRLIGNQKVSQTGEVSHLAGTIACINELKNAEILAADRLKYRDSFLSMLSHELRNPIAGIKYAVDIFQEGSDLYKQMPPECQTSLGIVKRQTVVLSRLINDLLNVSRVSLNQIRYEKHTHCFQDLMTKIVECAESLYLEKEQRLVLSCAENVSSFKGDRVRLTQLFTNLIDNASKFSPKGSQIKIVCQREGDALVTHVCDEGPGIIEESQRNIFDLFFQEKQPLDRNASGLGIGLYLVKRIAEAHDGTVTLSSPGKLGGCDFEVRLPLGDAASESSAAVACNSSPLVLVEDNEDARLGLSLALKSRGYDVTTLVDGEEAIEKIPGLSPRTVLIDIGLPKKDGTEVMRELRKDKRLSETFFIALTGYGQSHEREMVLEAGFDRHMVKPVDITELCAVIAARIRS